MIGRMCEEGKGKFVPYSGSKRFHEGVEGVWMEHSHHGLVLSTGEINGYDDSDFYAVVWNTETNQPERVEYATTRGWSYPNFAQVDATPEIQAAYDSWRLKREIERQEAAKRRERMRVAKGKTLEVVKGRKVPIGTKGMCFWSGYTKWGRSVGIETPAGRVFTDELNVVVVL